MTVVETLQGHAAKLASELAATNAAIRAAKLQNTEGSKKAKVTKPQTPKTEAKTPSVEAPKTPGVEAPKTPNVEVVKTPKGKKVKTADDTNFGSGE